MARIGIKNQSLPERSDLQVAELLKKVEKYDTIIKNNGNSSMDKKQTNLTVVYYNQSFGFMIVPYAIERNMKIGRAHV